MVMTGIWLLRARDDCKKEFKPVPVVLLLPQIVMVKKGGNFFLIGHESVRFLFRQRSWRNLLFGDRRGALSMRSNRQISAVRSAR